MVTMNFPFKFYQHRAKVFGVLMVILLVLYFIVRFLGGAG